METGRKLSRSMNAGRPIGGVHLALPAASRQFLLLRRALPRSGKIWGSGVESSSAGNTFAPAKRTRFDADDGLVSKGAAEENAIVEPRYI